MDAKVVAVLAVPAMLVVAMLAVLVVVYVLARMSGQRRLRVRGLHVSVRGLGLDDVELELGGGSGRGPVDGTVVGEKEAARPAERKPVGTTDGRPQLDAPVVGQVVESVVNVEAPTQRAAGSE